jgi:signal peptidase II
VTRGRAPAPGWPAALALAGVVVALDQASKAAARAAVAPGERISLIFGVHIVDVSNEGIAFGFLGDGGALVLAITIGALVAMLVWFARQPARPGLWLAVGLLAGGALGNLADRVRVDAVTDFIDPPLWPAFNVADIAITLGAVVLVLSVFVEPDSGEARAP